MRRREAVPSLSLRHGPTVFARPQDDAVGMFLEIVAGRCYTRRAFYRPTPSDTVVDIGANIGVFALECHRQAPGIRVHAVEPHPGTCAQLRLNVERNQLGDTIAVHELAVADCAGLMYPTPGVSTSGHQSLTREGNGTGIPTVALHELFDRLGLDRCDLLKVDTEGAELLIVEGAREDVWLRIPRAVFEYHDLEDSGRGERLRSHLTALGYTCVVVPHAHTTIVGLVYATRKPLSEPENGVG